MLPGISQRHVIRSWKTWETGVVPSFVLEIASDDFGKDYEENPVLYSELGVEELFIFDPHARPGSRSRRVRWQVYRRIRGRGLVRVEVSQSDRVRSKVLKAWLRALGAADDVRVRLATGARGDELYPTEAEAERAAKEQERAAKEQERAAKEQERAAKEQERAAKEQERVAKEQERAAKEQERAAKERERAAKERERAGRLEAEAEVKRLKNLIANKSRSSKRG